MIVGITPDYHEEDFRFLVNRHYVEAVRIAGGTPLVLPATTDRRLIRAYLQRVDRVLLTGGRGDNPLRDAFERALVHACYRRRLPLLGICRGHQMIAAFLGGSLVEMRGRKHDQRADPAVAHHTIDLQPGTELARILGVRRLRVNSLHRFAIQQLPAPLAVNARARDGVVEGIECMRGGRWIMGVQFHPERMLRTRPVLRRLFRTFVAGP